MKTLFKQMRLLIQAIQGALVDSRGYLVGINSAILSRGGGNNGIGFAIPSNMVKDIAKTYRKR